jgi:hypothetical protein
MKLCSKCKTNKEDHEFNFKYKSLNKRNSWCITCCSKRAKNDYQTNEHRRLKIKLNKEKISNRNRLFIRNYLLEHPCQCGETNITVLEFHHLHNKRYSVSTLINGSSISKIIEEIKKCEVICANCHKRKTAKEFNWHK